jgi:hypothetical protein
VQHAFEIAWPLVTEALPSSLHSRPDTLGLRPRLAANRTSSFNLKGVYRLNRNWELTGGYAYEKYKYSDIGYDGFRCVAGAGASASCMTGQYAFQPYTANIFYAMGTCKS